jgi:hypothetical protein
VPVVTAVTLAGQAIAGACISTTVTVNEHEAVLPLESVAVELTVVVPFGKAEPDGGLLTTVTPGQLSVAVTVKFTTAEHEPAAAGTDTLSGQSIAGGSISFTVTVNEQVAVLPPESVAVAITVVVPFGKEDPEGGVLTTITPLQSSEAVTVKFTTALQEPASVETDMFSGQSIAGGGLFAVTVAVAMRSSLSGSVVAEETLAVLLIIASSATEQVTATTRVNSEVPSGRESMLAVTVPLAPTTGVDGVHPAGEVNDTNVVAAGSMSVSVTFKAASGPSFVTSIVYVISPPGSTGSGVATLVIERSALASASEKYATGMSWSEIRSGLFASFLNVSGKSASFRA